MENNYSSAVTKAKKALSDITGEVVKLDEGEDLVPVEADSVATSDQDSFQEES